MSVECVRVEAIGCVRNKEGRMMNAERCVCCEKGERRKRKREREKELREQRETFTLSSPIPSFRCPRVCHAVRLNAKGSTESGSRVTERAGKGKIQSSSKLVAKRKIGPHISSWPATTTTAAAAAAAAAVAVAATTTKVGHTYKTKDFLCPHCLVDSRSATASNGSERD